MTFQPVKPILDGKALADYCLAQSKIELEKLGVRSLFPPKLAVILVGEDPASQVYVNKKAKVAKQLGMDSEVITLAADTSSSMLLETLDRLNHDDCVHGILVQLPLPKHLDTLSILEAIHPLKDVDGLTPTNLGKLFAGAKPAAVPCTPLGMIRLLQAYKLNPAGLNAVVLGRSNIVGKPIAQLLLNANATVTICHSKTRNLPEITKQADIIVAAIGIPEFVKAEHVKPGAIILDVGINRTASGKLVGDVDFEGVKSVAGWITPVPGGVGPMTIAMLMSNTIGLFRHTLENPDAVLEGNRFI